MLAKADSGWEGEDVSVLEKLIMKAGPDSLVPTTMAFDMMAAGIDTTGNTLSFLLYHLAANPEAQERLRAEVNGQEWPLTDRSFQRLRYLKAAQKESARLNPIFGLLIRVLAEDIELRGHHVPANTMVLANTLLSARSEDNFKKANR